jgi:hypothetical protein
VQIKNKKDGKTANVSSGNKAHSTGEGKIVISEILEGDLSDDLKDEADKDSTGELEIKLENSDGEKRIIKLEFE